VLNQRWLAPMANTDDPITALQHAFRRHIIDDTTSGNLDYGCPMNNLAQEMSPLDDGFRQRFDAMYDTWRQAIAGALSRGQREGSVRRDIDVRSVAALVVVGQIGVWSMGKHSQSAKLMKQAGEAMCDVLDTFRVARPTQRKGRRK